MFEDVPDKLNRWVLDAPANLRTPRMFSTTAALAVLKFYLGTMFWDSDSPLLSLKAKPGEWSPENETRQVQIAAAVFILRNEPGFPEVCRRLSTRDIQPAFFEAKSAEMFQSLGFSILARPETQSRGADFDFSISADGIVANVEASALEGEEFSRNRIRNALNQKRKQLPDDKPAIIILYAPFKWRPKVWNIEWEYRDVAEEFLRGTRRINYVYIVEDIFSRRLDEFKRLFHVLHYKNETPRIAATELDDRLARSTAEDIASRAIMRGESTEHVRGTGEFMDWVEWLRRQQS